MRIADQAESAFRVLVHAAGLRADRDGGVGEGRQGVPVSVEKGWELTFLKRKVW